jgi:hypothetical protein
MKKDFEKIITHIHPKDFLIPNDQPSKSYFPDFLENLLNSYSTFYDEKLVQFIDDKLIFEAGNNNVVIDKINKLNKVIIETVKLYYKGKILKASDLLFTELDKLLFDDIKSISSINKNTSYYRCRKDEGRHFKASDLFHIAFQERHIVSTNRYSVPGFPALYLGDTTYVCWEEFNKFRIRDLWFTRLENQNNLEIFQIQRIEDFLLELESVNPDLKLTFLLRYLITFPLSLACTIRVKHTNGSFKPEYIISQMLSEYVSMKDEIDGIKFPSTKVNYSSLEKTKAYNYVFPVKNISDFGYCPRLTSLFFTTEPTSLELEELIYNPTRQRGNKHGFLDIIDDRTIELIKNEKTKYSTTSFGKIEKSLENKKTNSI